MRDFLRFLSNRIQLNNNIIIKHLNKNDMYIDVNSLNWGCGLLITNINGYGNIIATINNQNGSIELTPLLGNSSILTINIESNKIKISTINYSINNIAIIYV